MYNILQRINKYFYYYYNSSFHEKVESIQYNVCLTITGTIRGTSSENIYQELGFESLKMRRKLENFVTLQDIQSKDSFVFF